MAPKSNLRIAKDSLSVPTEKERKQIEEYAAALRVILRTSHVRSPPVSHLGRAAQVSTTYLTETHSTAQASAGEPSAVGFLKLPKELRFMIYGLVITPEIAETHVKKNKIPVLLQINKGIRDDFAAFYYGKDVFKVELFDSTTSTWKEVRNPLTVQAMFEAWGCCFVHGEEFDIAWLKREHGSWSDDTGPFKDGVLTWLGGPDGVGTPCVFYEGARREEATMDRSKQLAKFRSACENSLRTLV